MELPDWLCESEGYEPGGRSRRSNGARSNVLRLTSLLERVRFGGGAGRGGKALSPVDRALAQVSAPLRLGGLLLAIVLVCLARSPLFLGGLLALALVLSAIRPERGLKATFLPALAAAALALVLALPASLMGAQAVSGMLVIALKVFVNVSLVLGVSWGMPWNRLSGALKVLHLPDVVIYTVDMALKHIEILGRSAARLSEALMLRSVGASSAKDALAASGGVMGATFLRAYRQGERLSEAMLCRGFTGEYPAPARASGKRAANIVYVLALAGLVACYLWGGR